jgi:recombination protein RecA
MSKKQNEETQGKFDAVLSVLKKTYGEDSIMRLDQDPIPTDCLSTGSLGLDIALGIGGLPKGRVIEIYGPESSGKTTLALHVMAEAQKHGGRGVFIDAEHSIDIYYAERIGIKWNQTYLVQPDNAEQALEMADKIIDSGEVAVIIIDSVSALVPQKEIEGEVGDAVVGLQARLMSQAMRKMTAKVKRTNTVVIFINQLRMKIGIMFGNPETTSGGNALKFYASVRLDIRRTGAVKRGEVEIGNRTKVKVVKNKVAPPHRIAEFDIIYGQGIDKAGEIIEKAVELKIVKQSGSWYSYGDTKLGQGKEATSSILRDNPELMEEIENKVKREVGLEEEL